MIEVVEVKPHQVIPLIALIDAGFVPDIWMQKYGSEMMLVFHRLLIQFQTNPDTRIRPVMSKGGICRDSCSNIYEVSCNMKTSLTMMAERQEYSDLFCEAFNNVWPKSYSVSEIREAIANLVVRRPWLDLENI